MVVLKLRGGQALSAFRLDKVNARLRDLAVTSATFWHFVESLAGE